MGLGSGWLATAPLLAKPPGALVKMSRGRGSGGAGGPQRRTASAQACGCAPSRDPPRDSLADLLATAAAGCRRCLGAP
eukprot:12564966-Alexandrium_andersonii.AAC.1